MQQCTDCASRTPQNGDIALRRKANKIKGSSISLVINDVKELSTLKLITIISWVLKEKWKKSKN